MFENFEKNQLIVTGAYKKLKSYYYYDKSILYNKMRLAMWESDEKTMNNCIYELARFLTTIEGDLDQQYFNVLMKKIDIIPMPKAFQDINGSQKLLSNVVEKDQNLSKVNFFVKAPVELLILDAIWMLMISKIAFDQKSIPRDAYANSLKVWQIFNKNSDLIEGIDFKSNRAFNPYFEQYSAWRNNAFKVVQDRYNIEHDSILISLDIKSYFYSVVFSFDDLPLFLNHDERLSALSPLTNLIRSLYINYTAEMQKYRGAIPADCKKNQCALPIGLFSSMILANLYLREFDIAIKEKLNPAYYGRYVDDILIVVDRLPDMDINVASIMQEAFVKNGLLNLKSDTEYIMLIPKGLSLQKDKIRCVYFDHLEPDAMIKLLCEVSNIKPSVNDGEYIEFMPDIDISVRTFDECAYSLGAQNGAIKVRDFLFSTNNYLATLFITDLIRASKNVDIDKADHRNFIQNQLDQILRFYNFRQAIEYRSAWINVFTLTVINKRLDYFVKFYFQILDAINSINTTGIETIELSKTETILYRIKDALIEQLNLSASIAFAPIKCPQTENEIDSIILSSTYLNYKISFSDIFRNAEDIRNANMFNNHVLSFPLISYIFDHDKCDQSLIDASPSDINNCSPNSQQLLNLSQRKVDLSPRFIHLEEICLFYFVCHYPEGSNPFSGKLDSLIVEFININNLQPTISGIESPFNSTVKKQFNLHRISVPSSRIHVRKNSNTFDTLKIALASINIDEATDVEPVLESPKHGLTPQKKHDLYKLLNEALENGANMIVFPEYFLPLEWLEELHAFSRKNSISIISGIRYLTHKDRAYNYLVVFQPFSAGYGFRYSLPLIREKSHYAPAEILGLAKHHFECQDPSNPTTHLISWKNLNYSDMLCYELTDIEYRYELRHNIELLIVPELNLDTEYFSNIVESTARDLHCFVVQANTSKYGDSRITGPYNSMFKDIIQIKGGENNVLLMGTIDLKELRKNRNSYQIKLQEDKLQVIKTGKLEDHKQKKKLKDPPAGFNKAKEVH